VVKRAGEEEQFAVQACSGTLKQRVNCTLGDLDAAHPDALSNLLSGIANLDFSKSIGPQIANLLVQQAIAFGQAIATSIHPVLGIFFSIFTALFGFPSNDQSDFIQAILDKVEEMITERLDTFATRLVYQEVSGAIESINSVASAANDSKVRWDGVIDGTLSSSFPKIFIDCWDSPNSDACKRWRTSGAKGQAMLLEVHYTELMLSTLVKYAEFGAKQPAFAANIWKAANLSRAHFQQFNHYRRNWASTESGVGGGSVGCAGRAPVICRTYPARDYMKGKDICARSNVNTTLRDRDAKRSALTKSFNNCVSQYKMDIAQKLDKVGSETLALQAAARRLSTVMR